jgi:hypothetical protein
MPSVPERALAEAERLGLDLGVRKDLVPTNVFTFQCLEPKETLVEAFREAKRSHTFWVFGMPLPILTYHPGYREYRIMDGMMRICAAKTAGLDKFAAYVASGETYDALSSILDEGYYGEDFVEMLAMVNDEIRQNLEDRDKNRLAGR